MHINYINFFDVKQTKGNGGINNQMGNCAGGDGAGGGGAGGANKNSRPDTEKVGGAGTQGMAVVFFRYT